MSYENGNVSTGKYGNYNVNNDADLAKKFGRGGTGSKKAEILTYQIKK